MNRKASLQLTLALSCAGLVALSACSTHKQADAMVQADAAKPHPAPTPAAVAVETIKTTSTVQAIDPAKRTVTLKNEGGAVTTYKCGKAVINFDQLKVGDVVQAEVTQAIAVFVRKGGTPALEAVSTVSLAPKGSLPGMIMTDATEVSARIDAIDAAGKTITVTGPLGRTRVLNISPDVNLENVKVGDEIVLRYAEGLALIVEKAPSASAAPSPAR